MTSLSGNLHANKAFSQMLGYTKKEIKDVNWRELTHPDDIKKMMKSQKVSSEEKSVLHAGRNVISVKPVKSFGSIYPQLFSAM